MSIFSYAKRIVRIFRVISVYVLLFVGTTATAAPILQFDNNGELDGALNVDVAGVLYDAQFLEGTFAEHFVVNGVTQLDATNGAQGVAFSNALLEQVLLGQFDANPSLTAGCESPTLCWINTPYMLAEDDFGVLRIFTVAAANSIDESLDGIAVGGPLYNFDNRNSWDGTWVKWSQTSVAEPSIGLIVMMGWLALVVGPLIKTIHLARA